MWRHERDVIFIQCDAIRRWIVEAFQKRDDYAFVAIKEFDDRNVHFRFNLHWNFLQHFRSVSLLVSKFNVLDINELIFERLSVSIFIDFANIDSDSSKSKNIICSDFDLNDWSRVQEELRSALIFKDHCNEDDEELCCDILFTCDQSRFVSEVKTHDEKVDWLRKRIEYEHHYQIQNHLDHNVF